MLGGARGTRVAVRMGMSNASQTAISLQDLAAVAGGAPRAGGITYGSPTTVTSAPWSNLNYNPVTNNITYGAGVRPPGMSMVEFRKLNPTVKPSLNRPLGPSNW